jgi:hypothetical protein
MIGARVTPRGARTSKVHSRDPRTRHQTPLASPAQSACKRGRGPGYGTHWAKVSSAKMEV